MEWATNSDNQKHAYKMGLKSANKRQKEAAHISGLKSRKLTYAQAEEIRTLYNYGCHTRKKLALLYMVSRDIIENILNNKSYVLEDAV